MLDCFLQVKTNNTCTSNHDEGQTNEPSGHVVAPFGCQAVLKIMTQQSPHLCDVHAYDLNTHKLATLCVVIL